MKKALSVFLFLCLVSSVFGQYKPVHKISMARDDNYAVVTSRPNVNWATMHNDFAPAGTVPFPINYNDYWTNGQNVRRILVLGDTIIVSNDVNPDLTGPPPATLTTRTYYQVSYDGGLTWLSDAINISPSVATRWPNLAPIFNSGSRSIAVTGRIYNTAQQGVTMIEAILGLGSFTVTSTPAMDYRDFFGYQKNATSLGGVISAPAGGATDSMFYYNYTYATNTYSGRKLIAPDLQASFRCAMTIADNGQNVYATYWRSANANGKDIGIYNFESSDGGGTFGAGIPIGCPSQGAVGGDSISAWFGMDVIYKPGTTFRCLAFSTLAPGSLGTRLGSKLLYWSPTINGGNAVVICDHNKVAFLNDTASFNNNLMGTQVGLTLLSHPSLGYSSDGTKLYCVFSATQKDTSTLGGGLINYNYNDIYACMSTDNGATWSNPRYVTNTAKRDELYPSISKSGNTGTTFNLIYSESGTPGSYTFTDNQVADTVYTVFKRIANFTGLVQVPVGVTNISTEVPAKFELSQNYPNPFNPTTKINFALPKSGFVSLKVYDVSGREVATLVDERLSIGTYEYSFNANGLSSGIYFYSLQAGDFKETKKMMLIK